MKLGVLLVALASAAQVASTVKTVKRTVKVIETKTETAKCCVVSGATVDVWGATEYSTEPSKTSSSEARLPRYSASYDLDLSSNTMSYGSFSDAPVTTAVVSPITTGSTTLVLVGTASDAVDSSSTWSFTNPTSFSTTQSNPLYTGSAPSSSRSVSIDPNTISSGTTVSSLATNNATYSENATAETSVITYTSTYLTYPVSENNGFSSLSFQNASQHMSLDAIAVTVTKTSTAVKHGAAAATSTINLFRAIATSNPSSLFKSEALGASLAKNVKNYDVPYQTNKFFTNMMLDDQDDTVFTYPYGFFYSKTYAGVAISYRTPSEWYYDSSTTPPSYFYGPIDVASIVFSSSGFTSSNIRLGLNDMYHLSATAKLYKVGHSDSYIEIPLVEGMGFATAVYHGNLTPLLHTGAAFSSLTSVDSDSVADGVKKYEIKLSDDSTWLAYVTVPDGHKASDFKLSMKNSSAIVGTKMDGLIVQLVTAPDSDLEVYYDEAAGMYATYVHLSGSLPSGGDTASYQLTYKTAGKSSSGKTILFAETHHVNSMASSTKQASTGIVLYSVTKGKLYGYLTNELAFEEDISTVKDIGFLPWSESMVSDLSYTSSQLKKIAAAANDELDVDIASAVNVDSTYYAGKILDKYAYILLVLHKIVGDSSLTKSVLADMKTAFAVFTTNKQYYPLMYDTKFKGVTSTAATTSGDSGADFGSSYYNDHHFHYGYFVHAAAVVGYVDSDLGGEWAETNKDWVNALVRDVANPTTGDSHFPVSRMFDWYQGHSWAAGLFSGGDGRNEESSSEDYNFAYGMKLWGKVIGDESMENRANLMLAVLRRSMNEYFYYWDNNGVEPSSYIPNKVSGIMFENKIAYTTYFGTNTEYIHGIHMLPITPISSFVRRYKFVKQEWSEKLSSIVGDLTSGWAGVLRMNQAIIDPASSYSFFSSSSFSSDYLDDGLSLTWALAYSGGLKNSV